MTMKAFTQVLAASASIGMAAAPISVAAQDLATVVTVESGKVSGVSNGNEVSWRGIPYVEPPVGSLRWRAPRAAASWKGVRPATEFGPNCPQPQSGFAAAKPSSEDCLTINVWAPKDYKGKKLPVMVSVHGGAYILGSGDLEDTTSFTRDGIVMVSMNYRLGRLGQFAHPALTAENPSGPLGSYTVMDQVAALQWVKRNIAGFGGDPAAVTIFGCSAGGTYVNMLMGSPKAQGLFRGAIAESDPFNTPWPRLKRTGRTIGGSAEDLGAAFATSIGLPNATAADLRAVAVSKFISPAETNAHDRIQPIVDGEYVIQGVDAFESGKIARVPYVTSINSWEGILAGYFDPNGTTIIDRIGPSKEKVLALYTPQQRASPRTIASMVMDDINFRASQRIAARGSVAAGNRTWGIYFDYVAESVRPQSPMGSAHCSNVSYVFESPRNMVTKITATPNDMKVARAMHSYYVNFARAGNPNGVGLPQWPEYGEAENLLLVTKDGFKPVPNPGADRMKVLIPASNEMGRGAGLKAMPASSRPADGAHVASSPGASRLTVESPIEALATNPQAKAILERHVPTITTSAMYPRYKSMSLKQLAEMSGGRIGAETIAAIAADLNGVK
jgi:para-nitrobenzyl esterase